LQEGTIERVGGEKPLRVNVRVIAATHRPLEAMLKRGSFRADLYYRLNVFPVKLPPLRERREDIPPLVHYILDGLAARLNIAVPTVSREALRQLVEADWPGNVRELANTLERALILSRDGTLVVEGQPESDGKSPTRGEDAGNLVTLEEATRQCIETALASCAGRIYGKRGAARRLGLRPSTLQSKMAKLGISRTRFINTNS
jgi:formate hydrogenlyase transcriptional activator